MNRCIGEGSDEGRISSGKPSAVSKTTIGSWVEGNVDGELGDCGGMMLRSLDGSEDDIIISSCKACKGWVSTRNTSEEVVELVLDGLGDNGMLALQRGHVGDKL